MNYLIGLLLLGCGGKITSSVEKDTYVEETVEDTAVEEEVVEETEEQETGEIEEPVEEDTGEIDSITDFLQRGPYEVIEESKLAQVTNCNDQPYSVYTPVGVSSPPVVVLGHGFARGPDTMRGWASHLASWGVEVLLPTLCHYNVFAGVDHETNGQNMKELAVLHGATNVVYAGHSAGGLAAIIAASQDSNASGILGLDVTDTQGIPGIPDFIGQQYADLISVPAFSLRGEPDNCNSNGNGLTLFEMMEDSYKIKISEADHCDFEYPTNAGCEISCQNLASNTSDSEIRSEIIILGTSAILALFDISDSANILWMGSQ